jgi:hypothetical protein
MNIPQPIILDTENLTIEEEKSKRKNQNRNRKINEKTEKDEKQKIPWK